MKLSEVQRSLNAPKNQRNDFGKYNYRYCEDILQAVKPLLGEAIILLSDDIQVVGDRVYVKATATFKSAEETIEVTAFAREPLNKKGMDESQITGAASSYARKYALNGLLLIDDNKDADSQKPVDNNAEYKAFCELHTDSINAIKDSIRDGDYSSGLEAWQELTDEEKKKMWKAPSKGGCFTTEERKIMQSTEFRKGENINVKMEG